MEFNFNSDNMFKIIIASDDNHEKVFAEIYFHEKYVALINQEKGIDELELEFPDCDNMDQQFIIRAIPLKEFIGLIQEARLKLTGNL